MAAKTSWHRYGTKLRNCHIYVLFSAKYEQQNSTVAGATAAERSAYDADNSSCDDVKSAVEVRDEGQHPKQVSHVLCNSRSREHAGQAGHLPYQV